MTLIEKARALRRKIEILSASLDDEQALETVELFPAWKADTVYTAGDRVRYNDVLYKVLQGHTSQADWTPDGAVSLFAKVLIPSKDIPVWEQPTSTNAYMTGDRVYYPTAQDDVYESLIDNNVWSPTAYPQGWKVIEV